MATGVNLIVLVQSLFKGGGGGAGKCTFKTGVSDSWDKGKGGKKGLKKREM